jgi:hypothetical protein
LLNEYGQNHWTTTAKNMISIKITTTFFIGCNNPVLEWKNKSPAADYSSEAGLFL